MDLALLKKLVKIVERSTVDEVEIEEEGLRIRVARTPQNHVASAQPVTTGQIMTIPVAPAVMPQMPPSAEIPIPQAKAETKYHEIKSPIVGTFYRAPAPDAEPYVEVGQVVQPKQVLCIIEAMKLMNEIESDIGGRIVKINVENGQPVEYNQTLFLIESV
jgi:acetyl-CoA carboxylase biotin carboxyl carrier protein